MPAATNIRLLYKMDIPRAVAVEISLHSSYILVSNLAVWRSGGTAWIAF